MLAFQKKKRHSDGPKTINMDIVISSDSNLERKKMADEWEITVDVSK